MMPDPIVNRWRSARPQSRRGNLLRAASRRLLVPAVFTLAVSVGVPAQAQDQGKKIAAVEFRGLKTLSEDTLRYYLGVEPGQMYDQEKLNAKIKALWDRNLIDDISVETLPGGADPSGVRLLIKIEERPILRSIEYEGVKRLSKTDIQDKIATTHIRVKESEPLSLGELQRVKSLIEDLYREKGYRFAQARYKVEELPNHERKVLFTVDEGDRVRISEIRFVGNTIFDNARLRWAMKKTKETALIARVTKKDIYDPAKLQEDLDKVRELYRNEGYKNVVIGDPKVEVIAENPGAKTIKEQRRLMHITIPLEEGERWKFGDVSIDGNKVYPDQALLRALAHRPGSWLGAKALEDGVKQITDLYHNTGYILAQVEPEIVEKPGNVADLLIHIREGEQFKVGRIEFKGNENTMDKVLRREVRLWEGGLVNIGAVRNSVLKINQLGYFKLDEEDPVDIDTQYEKKEVSLVFKGKEAARTELQFGGGWSELDGFFGQFGINTKNFLGRGEQVGVSYQKGNFRNLLDLSYYIPWFLDKPQSLGIRLYSQDTNIGELSTEQLVRNGKGAIITYGRNLGLFSSVSVSYNRSNYDDLQKVTDITNPDNTVIESSKVIDSSSIRPAFTYDSRDNPYEPIRGTKFQISTEYAGGFLKGNNYFVRPELSFSLFRPVTTYPTKTVFALNFQAGVIRPFDGRAIDPFELYRLGGENSIRGHQYQTLYPRDANNNTIFDSNGFIVYGDRFVQYNLEYHFLLGGPFRVLLFTDGGNTYATGQKFDLSRLRYTAGIELRVVVPVFGAPLRFIYSKNLNPLPQDQFESFQFSIGTSF